MVVDCGVALVEDDVVVVIVSILVSVVVLTDVELMAISWLLLMPMLTCLFVVVVVTDATVEVDVLAALSL